MTEDQAEAKAACEHFYASHCYRGMSIRLCMTCHEPDWDDLECQLYSGPSGDILPVPSVAALRAYMAATGWDQDGPAGFAGAIWRNGEAAIGVPNDDLDQLMIKGVISRVARKEGRAEGDVIRDIAAATQSPRSASLTAGAGIVRAYECGTTEPAAPREAAGGLSQVGGGGSGI